MTQLEALSDFELKFFILMENVSTKTFKYGITR